MFPDTVDPSSDTESIILSHAERPCQGPTKNTKDVVPVPGIVRPIPHPLGLLSSEKAGE